MLRVFGCLVYFVDQTKPKGPGKKFRPKALKGVFLGLCPMSSGWLIGTFRGDSDTQITTEILSLKDYSSRDVRFLEDVFVRDLSWLKPGNKAWIPIDPLEDLVAGASLRTFSPLEQVNSLAHRPGSLGTEHGASESTGKILQVESLDDKGVSLPGGSGAEEGSSPTPMHSMVEPPVQSVVEPTVKPVRGRGRPLGSKDKVPRKRRTKKELENLCMDLSCFASVVGGVETEADEQFVEAHIMLSVKQALASPDSEKWEKVIEKERARLLAFETWRPATDEEIASAKQVLPIAVILTVKRCGTHKARACVLGNIERCGTVDTFAPVVSQSANRLLLVSAASEGDYVVPFDLDSAFLNAELDRDVCVSLPPIWSQSNGREVVKLRKALYGLRDAPRAWYRRYHQILSNLGWHPCQEAPGLWRRRSQVEGRYDKLSVYVDDNFMAGPVLQALHTGLEEVFKCAPGRILDVQATTDVQGNQWLNMDFLGSSVSYCRELRSVRLTMEPYIEKILQKFNVVLGKPAYSPNFDEAALDAPESKVVESFASRSVVGALQWVCTTGRPDICVPVAALARHASKPPTVPFVNACKKVLKYLATTKSEGLSYSPQSEAEFTRIYSKLLPEGRTLPEMNLFSDASFGNCLKTMRSTSGSICYFKSFPIAWRSNRQTVRAYSTAESEYIAAADTLILSEQTNFMDFFKEPPSKLVHANHGVSLAEENSVLWVDNQSAIATAKSTDLKPKSRHYALRYLRVRDAASRIVFCPTNLMKADGLTKLECSVPQRNLILHHIDNPHWEVEDDTDTGEAFLLLYSSCFGF